MNHCNCRPRGHQQKRISAIEGLDSMKNHVIPSFVRPSIAFLFLSLLLFCCVSLQAQVSGGTLSGTVMDSTGAVVPNAQVTVTNLGTGIARTTVTNDSGFYGIPNLNPGNYQVT